MLHLIPSKSKTSCILKLTILSRAPDKKRSIIVAYLLRLLQRIYGITKTGTLRKSFCKMQIL